MAALLGVGAAAQAGTTERFSVVANGENVGHVVAVRNGATIDIDYAVSDNGRGPKHKEHLVLGSNGIPVEWSIEGTSLMGGPVSEHASWKNGCQGSAARSGSTSRDVPTRADNTLSPTSVCKASKSARATVTPPRMGLTFSWVAAWARTRR